jgi:hypothetical protein
MVVAFCCKSPVGLMARTFANDWDTLKDFFAKFDEVAASISSTGAEDILRPVL